MTATHQRILPTTDLPRLATGPGSWLPVVRVVLDAMEPGALVILRTGRIVAANGAMAQLVGLDVDALLALRAEAFLDHVRALVDGVPPLLASGAVLARDAAVVCEELELVRPSRSVVRWVARQVALPGLPAQLVTCTDITVEVDLVTAQQRQASTDRLTGCLNRRGVEAAIARERSRAARLDRPLSLVLCDVDHFKRVNDAHGHVAGDLVLRQVGAAITAALRGSDVCARWGGEEFLLVLCDVDEVGARACAARVLAAVAALALPSGPVTVSAGVAEVVSGEPLGAAIKRADAGLYRAKSGGRNRVG